MQKQKFSTEELDKFAQESYRRILQLEKNQKWEQFEDDPCEMYSLTDDNRMASKGVGVISASTKEIDEFLSKEENQKKLGSNIKEFRTLEEIGDFRVRYRRHEGSWPVQDRDMIMLTSRKYEGDRLIIASRSIDYDFPPVEGVTRADCYIAGYIIDKIDAHTSKVHYFSDLDLKGSIPGILRNKLSRAQAEQPDKLKKAMGK